MGGSKTAVIFGEGAVSDSIAYVLDCFDIQYQKFSSRMLLGEDESADFFINASPVGMSHIPDHVFCPELIDNFKYVFDVVVSPEETKLIKIAKELGKSYVRGGEMCLHQLCSQFRLYTGQSAPQNLFWKILKDKGYV